MNRNIPAVLIPIFLAAFFILFYYYSISFDVVEDRRVFLSISTFLFAIFTGFFIARQGRRHTEIRQKISRFDGNMTFIYRSFGHFSGDIQKKLGEIIKRHYKLILDTGTWDYHFKHDSDTLSSIHKAIDEELNGESLKTLQTNTLNRVVAALLDTQVIRKDLVSLHREHIPRIQWIIILFLALILLSSLFLVPSLGLLLESTLKAAFATAVVYVLVLLSQLNRLELFEGTIGESSAKDVLQIVDE